MLKASTFDNIADAEACAQIALLIIPEPKKARKAKKADKDTYVGDLFAPLIPQPIKKTKSSRKKTRDLPDDR